MERNSRSGGNVLVKLVVGALAIGAAALTAKFLSKEENRKKVSDGVSKAAKKGVQMMDEAKVKGTLLVKEIEKNGPVVLEKLKTEFDNLRMEIESSDFSDKMKTRVDEIADSIRNWGNQGEKDVQEASEKIKKNIDKLKNDFEKQKAGA